MIILTSLNAGHIEQVNSIFNTVENLEEYIINLDPNSHLARIALEYLTINSHNDLKRILIDKLSVCCNKESQLWANIYDIDYKISKGELDLINGTEKLTYIKCEDISPEMSILKKIFQMYNYQDLSAFNMVESLSGLVNAELNMLLDGFMTNSLRTRHGLLMQSIYLHKDEVEKSIEMGEQILDIAPTPIMKIIAFKNLGNAYTFTDYDKAFKYFKQAQKYVTKLSRNHFERQNIKRCLNFLHCIWGKLDKVNFPKNKASLDVNGKLSFAFYLIKSNSPELASDILKETEGLLDNHYLKGFYYHHLGLLENNESYIYESIKHYNLIGDNFYKKLPLIYLKERGINLKLLEALSV